MQHTTTLRGPPLGKKKKRRGLKAAEGEPEPPEEGGAVEVKRCGREGREWSERGTDTSDKTRI